MSVKSKTEAPKMSYTYSQPPGRTRQQRDRKPRQKQWNSEEQDTDTFGGGGRPRHGSGYSHHPAHRPPHPPLSPHKLQSQHEHQSPQEHHPLQYHGSYYVKAPNAAKRAAVAKIKQDEEAEYSAYQAKKRSHLSDSLSQLSPTKLGGKKLDESDIAAMREKQEKEARLTSKFESIRKREKREQYIAEQKQRENQVYKEKKQKARAQAEQLEEKERVEGDARREELRRARLRYFDNMK